MSAKSQHRLNTNDMITVMIRTAYVESTVHLKNQHRAEFHATIDAVRLALRGIGYVDETIDDLVKDPG